MKSDLSSLNTFATESINPATRALDRVSTLEMVTLINQEDQKVAPAVQTQLPNIARAVDTIADALAQDGRLVYLGAGTSGRLGILDASECPPTYGVSEQTVMGLIAGGPEAILRARENVEDSFEAAETDLRAIRLAPGDIVCAIAASGRTPYCLGGMRYARRLGCRVIALVCNKGSAMAAEADIAIEPEVGPEAVTGSTRMKAGTAQKMVLNMLSTGAMVRLGKVYGNLMVDVQATNEKLRVRSENIVMQATGTTREAARKCIAGADGHVKLAIVMASTGLDAATAQLRLQQAKGRLHDIPEMKAHHP